MELTSSVFKENLVVETQTQLRHPRQEDAHLNGSHNLTAQNVTIGTNLKCQIKQYNVMFESFLE